MTMRLDKNDIQWIRKYYPDLMGKDSSQSRLSGTLKFSALYDKGSERCVINPDTSIEPQQLHIKDQYDIEINFSTVEKKRLPLVRETGDRLKNVAEQKGLSSADIHCFKDWHSCLCFELEIPDYLPNGFNVQDFFHNLLIPYFYAQSYFEKYDEWPWGEYAHDILAFFEWYYYRKITEPEKIIKENLLFLKKQKLWKQIKDLLHPKKQVKGHHYCLCGSQLKFRDCHPEMLKGIWKMKYDIAKYKIRL